MPLSNQTIELLEAVARVLVRAWLFGLVLVTIWFLAYLLAGSTIYELHSQLFDLTRHEFNLIFYCFMGSAKIIVLVFFLLPWLAIRLVLKKARA